MSLGSQSWAIQIVLNMIGAAPGPAEPVPIPFGAVIGAGLLLAAFGGWRLRRRG